MIRQRKPSRAVLQRMPRQYLLAGHDTSQLIDQITAAPMNGARSSNEYTARMEREAQAEPEADRQAEAPAEIEMELQ